MQEDSDNIQVLPAANEITEQGANHKNREKLPKFTLGRNEGFYISKEQIVELNDAYFQMLGDMGNGNDFVPEELRSYMESVIFASYVNEIEKMQRDNYLESELERERRETLNCLLTPRRWRSLLLRRKRNQSAILLDELINRQAIKYYTKKESELPRIDDAEEAQPDPYAVQLDTLRGLLPRMRKKKRAVVEEIILGLAASYEGKETKIQRLNSELQEEQVKVEQLTSELKKDAVKRLVSCLNAIKETKEPTDWEILKLRRQLEEAKTAAEPTEPDEDQDEYWGEDEFADEECDEDELE